jgi:tetratricopeptide (TPR) repeat protein
MFLSFAALALAAPEVLLVGVHEADVFGEAALAAADRLAEALASSGKVEVVGPKDVSARLRGKEALVLEQFGMGAGRERLQAGKLLYDRAELDQAIPALEDAVKILSGGLAYAARARELQDAYVLLGVARNGMGDEEGVRAAFRQAIALDPARELNTVSFPPQVVELYNSVRRELTTMAPATVTVRASSAAATVWVDGREVGPAPVESLNLPAGTHHILVRGEGAASWFQSVKVGAGEKRALDAMVERRGVGAAAPVGAARVRQVKELYRAVGQYGDGAVVVLAGETAEGQVGVQLYAPASGQFSRPLMGDAGSDPVAAMCDLAPGLANYLTENGDIRGDRVSPQVLAVDIGSNDVLARILFDPWKDETPVVTTPERRGVPWVVWAGVGVLAAGGGVAAIVLATNAGDDTGGAGDGNGNGNGGNGQTEDPNQGTVEVPLP